MKSFINSHRKIIISLISLILLFIILDILFHADEYFQARMKNEVKVVTECGQSASSSSYVQTVSNPEMTDMCNEIIINSGDTSGDELTITCNVDWGEEVLPDILDILEEKNLHITFFVTGKWAEKNPQLLRKMFLKGHEIQSHGYRHKLCSQISEDEVKKEIEKTSEAIQNILGIRVTIFAPPSGDFDDNTVKLCKDMGLKLSLWTADTIDWKEGSTAEVIHERIMSKDLHGAIILMHPKPETAKALPGLIDEIQQQGLKFVTLSELADKKEKAAE